MLAKLTARITFETAQLASTRERLVSLRATVEKEEANVETLEQSKKAIEQELESLQKAIERQKRKLEETTTAYEESTQAVEEVRGTARKTQKILDQALKEIAAANDVIEKLGSDRHAIYRKCRLEEVDLPLVSGKLDRVPLEEVS